MAETSAQQTSNSRQHSVLADCIWRALAQLRQMRLGFWPSSTESCAERTAKKQHCLNMYKEILYHFWWPHGSLPAWLTSDMQRWKNRATNTNCGLSQSQALQTAARIANDVCTARAPSTASNAAKASFSLSSSISSAKWREPKKAPRAVPIASGT